MTAHRWETPRFSRFEIDAAGRVLIDPNAPDEARASALDVLDNWRASHRFPLNSFQMKLRQKATPVYESALVAQRLKRAASIESKLRLRDWVTLSSMQDIGGCRAIVRSNHQVYRIREGLLGSRSLHKLIREKDYIKEPRSSGYRGLHLIYSSASNKSTPYEGLQVEMQLRTRLQHAWATAVETVGFIINQSLKSSLGEPEWLEFFRFASAAFALEERQAPVPGVTTNVGELRDVVRRSASELKVAARLRAFAAAVTHSATPEAKRASYFLLSLRAIGGRFQLNIVGFARKEEAAAAEEYSRQEKQLSLFPGADSVLVAVSSLEALRRSYPNYFLDTKVFLDYLDAFTNPKRRPN